MYEQMDEATDRCWAYNKAGQRCEMVAGHDRDHNVIIAWTNDECWAPGDTIEVTLKEYGVPRLVTPMTAEQQREVAALGPVPIYGEDKPGVCILCNHAMHVTECERGGCDCRSGIGG